MRLFVTCPWLTAPFLLPFYSKCDNLVPICGLNVVLIYYIPIDVNIHYLLYAQNESFPFQGKSKKMNHHSTKDVFSHNGDGSGINSSCMTYCTWQTVVSEAVTLQAYKWHGTQNNYGKPNGK